MHRKFTPDPEAAAEKRAALVQSLEAGFTRVQSSEEYRAYLSTLARFHNYSLNNVLLIYMQRPDAQRVAGFHAWQSLGRNVRKGEKGISILAPCTYKAKVTNDQTGEEERVGVRGFRAVSVFDVAQTEGADLPEVPCTRLSGDDRGLVASLEAIALREGLTIDRTPGRAGASTSGFYIRDRREIWVSPDLSPAATAKTLAHELGHHFAGHVGCRGEAETIAESVAYLVLGHAGIDAGEYSFGYLASWSDVATFRAALTEVNSIATRIIDGMDGDGIAASGELAAPVAPVATVGIPVVPAATPAAPAAPNYIDGLCRHVHASTCRQSATCIHRRCTIGQPCRPALRIKEAMARYNATGKLPAIPRDKGYAGPAGVGDWFRAIAGWGPEYAAKVEAWKAREPVNADDYIGSITSGPSGFDWSWAVPRLHPQVWQSIDALLRSERHAA